MSDTSQGPGWWIASDGKWYPPQPQQAPPPPPPPPAPLPEPQPEPVAQTQVTTPVTQPLGADTAQGPDWYLATDGKWYPPQPQVAPFTAPIVGADASQGPGWYQATDGKWYPPPGSAVEPKGAKDERPWYKKKRFIGLGIIAIIVIIIIAANAGKKSSNTTSATVAPANGGTPSTSPAPTQPAATTPPTAAGPKTTFGDGTWAVNSQIAPGTYTTAGGGTCYWSRSSDLTGNTSSILANDLATGHSVVTILPSDVGFKSDGCGTWTPLPSSGPQATSFSDGTWAVGIEIAPGTYSAPGGGSCYWSTLSDLTGGSNSIITNDLPSGPVTVTIDPTVKGFKTNGCGPWTKA